MPGLRDPRPYGQPSQEFRTLFLQEMLERGVLGQSFVISAAHTDDDVDRTVEAVAEALTVYAQALEAGSTAGLLRGRPVAPALRRFAAPRRLRGQRRPAGRPLDIELRSRGTCVFSWTATAATSGRCSSRC